MLPVGIFTWLTLREATFFLEIIMQDVVIVAAKRTAIGCFQGSLANITAVELGSAVIRSLLSSSGINAADIDEVIMGQVLTSGCGQNPARQAAINAGLPFSTSAMTLNKLCGSGLKAMFLEKCKTK